MSRNKCAELGCHRYVRPNRHYCDMHGPLDPFYRCQPQRIQDVVDLPTDQQGEERSCLVCGAAVGDGGASFEVKPNEWEFYCPDCEAVFTKSLIARNGQSD